MTEEERKRQSEEREAPVYAGTYERQMQDMYDRIVNREAFRYDPDEDALWNSYKDSYEQSGRLAMKDTMGQAAALTGGYGSTYSQSVGQQQYGEYMRELTAKLPELYGISRRAYDAEGEGLMKRYELLGDLRDTEYGAYRDALSDYNYEQEQGVKREQREYERQQDAYDSLLYMIKVSGYRPSDEELGVSGMSRERAEAAREAWKKENPQAAYMAGEIDVNEYYNYTGRWPAGYTPPSANRATGGGRSSAKISAYDITKTLINGLQQLGPNPDAMEKVIENTANKGSTPDVSGLTKKQIVKLEKMIKR